MKNTLKLLIPLFVAPLLIGCRTPVVFSASMKYELGSVRKSSSTSFYYSANSADGSMTAHINIKSGQSLDLKASYTVELGALTVSILDKDKNELYDEIIVDNKESVYALNDYGNYDVKIEIDEFRGNLSFSWAK